jgi:hypothetical protein
MSNPDLCEGHPSTNGPIGNVEYCDGSCQGYTERCSEWWASCGEGDPYRLSEPGPSSP